MIGSINRKYQKGYIPLRLRQFEDKVKTSWSKSRSRSRSPPRKENQVKNRLTWTYCINHGFMFGQRIFTDESKALKLCKSNAIHACTIDAQRALALYYHCNFQLSTALHWYEKASKQGDAEANYQIGTIYADGDGDLIPQDEKKAISFYKLAAAQQHKYAIEELSNCYQFGRGIIKDPNESYHLVHMLEQFQQTKVD